MFVVAQPVVRMRMHLIVVAPAVLLPVVVSLAEVVHRVLPWEEEVLREAVAVAVAEEAEDNANIS